MAVRALRSACALVALLSAPRAAVRAQEAPAAASPPIARRDVLLITLDTTRRDYLGCYGNEQARTPNLDYIAKHGLLFDDALTAVPITLPSHASLMTGQYPTTHGVRYNLAFHLPESAHTLAEILREAGWATRADVAAFVLDPTFGIGQGFDRYRAPARSVSRPGAAEAEPSLAAPAIVDRVLEDVGELAPNGGPPVDGRKPFFVWAHFYDPHAPYEPREPPRLSPEEAQDRQLVAKACYAQEIAEVDHEIGRLVRELGARKLLNETVIVVCSDHGESLGDAIESQHGFFLLDPTVRVPLIIRHPELRPQTVNVPTSLVDVAPTLLSLLHVDAAAERFDGLDLLPWIADPALAPPDRALMLESLYVWLNYGWAPHFGCEKEGLKYLRSARQELYERATDPTESKDLFVEGEPRAAALWRMLQAHLAKALPLASAATAVSEADRAAIEKLGYAAGDAGAGELPDDWSKLPDGYLRWPAYQKLNESFAAAQSKGIAALLEETKKALAIEPQSAALHAQIGQLLLEFAPPRFVEAAAEFDLALATDPRRARTWLGRARCGELAAEAERALAKTARETGGVAAAKPHVVAERKQLDAAEAAARRALGCDGSFPDALALLTRVLTLRADRALQRGEKGDARKLLAEMDALFGRLVATLPPTVPEWADASARQLQARKMLEKLAAEGAGGK